MITLRRRRRLIVVEAFIFFFVPTEAGDKIARLERGALQFGVSHCAIAGFLAESRLHFLLARTATGDSIARLERGGRSGQHRRNKCPPGAPETQGFVTAKLILIMF